MIVHRAWHWPAAVGALLVVASLGIAFGTVRLSLAEVFTGAVGTGDPLHVTIVQTLRGPRVLLAALVGAGLAMSGASLQGVLRNALAEPYLLGVSGGAAVGAVIAYAAGLSGYALLALAAFAGSLTAVGATVLAARAAGHGARSDPRTLLMAGVVVGAFANAAIMIALANAPGNTVRSALWWMMGSASDATWMTGAALALTLSIGGGALVAIARDIDALALGDEAAAALGVDVDRAAPRIYLLASLVAAATVAAVGLVGFVGLIVPHLVRAAGVRRHRALLLGAAIVGATLVIAADTLARVALPPAELPLGAVTAILGVPFFLAQLRRFRA
ncbi:iron ABC transporter permease [soil metagenome]